MATEINLNRTQLRAFLSRARRVPISEWEYVCLESNKERFREMYRTTRNNLEISVIREQFGACWPSYEPKKRECHKYSFVATTTNHYSWKRLFLDYEDCDDFHGIKEFYDVLRKRQRVQEREEYRQWTREEKKKRSDKQRMKHMQNEEIMELLARI